MPLPYLECLLINNQGMVGGYPITETFDQPTIIGGGSSSNQGTHNKQRFADLVIPFSLDSHSNTQHETKKYSRISKGVVPDDLFDKLFGQVATVTKSRNPSKTRKHQEKMNPVKTRRAKRD
jgi:hypothetical protein